MTSAHALQRHLESRLATSIIGRSIHCFDAVDSTNRIARRLAAQGAPDGTVVVAGHQSAGRGRLDRQWFAPPGSSILCSVVLYPAVEPERLFRLTMAASVAVVDALQAAAGIAAGIKWPNDIYAAGKKLCGILTEIDCGDGAVRSAIVGIGLNVNWSPRGTALDGQATSVADLAGRHIHLEIILLELLRQLDGRYNRLADSGLVTDWQSRCVHLGKTVRVVSGSDVVQGVARGITQTGSLLLETPDGLKDIICGDVSLLM